MTLNNEFPAEIFPETIQTNFKFIARQENLPIDFLYSSALYAIGALSGNMYYLTVKGKIRKPIIYSALVGPSSVGKSPSFDIVCGSIVAPLRTHDQEQLAAEVQAWRTRRNEAKNAKQEFDEPQPRVKLRIIEEATMEAILKYAEMCPAGFGIYYDEGAQLFTGINKYKAESKTDDFWNTNFNGKPFHQVRVDADRERYVRNPAISILMGLQYSRLGDYFKRENIESGLFNRFLFTVSDYIQLNTEFDISVQSQHACDDWQWLIKSLYRRGTAFIDGSEIEITMDYRAMAALNKYIADLTDFTNKKIAGREKASGIDLEVAYDGKMYGYIFKFCMILAIMDNPNKPVITDKHVRGAKGLTKYYKRTSHFLLGTLFNQSETGMNEFCQQLYNSLPDKFDTAKAMLECSNLGLNEKYFLISLNRGHFKGFIERVDRGMYEKLK